ncbi:hypothetical protein [Pseudoalteromonas ruthenica]|uniref:hypothetical protein n=1 Tax=Pseudoalteromonas ruthenica TaxID=151081 RepID=UPI00110ACB06|nr:hypothetical protein [Pseudoalteromonas ruthenica]TMP23769.1 hypothetical protein CWC06_09450 [Pseudoalteromonas ruthenica]
MSNTIERSSLKFEQWCMTILGLLTVSGVSWIALTVNENQVQYTQIKERLNGQTAILIDLQNKAGANAQWRSRVDTDIAVMERRLQELERERKE